MYSIKLRRQNHSVKLTRVTSPINIRRLNSTIRIKHGLPGIPGRDGRAGEPGPQGEPGVGVPPGGSTAQILAKASPTSFDTHWVDNLGSDKSYTAYFTVATEVLVTHNLNKYPSVTVLDSAEEEVEGQVDYINPNQLIVYFGFPFSGRVVCN